MTTPPPSTDRPETILSEYGEGYCRHCQFIVGLNYSGVLVTHTRGAHGYNPTECKGSNTRPPVKTPYMSKKAAFKTAAKLVTCHMCRRRVMQLTDGRMVNHTVAGHLTTPCDGSYRVAREIPAPVIQTTLAERDHGQERG